MENQGKALKSGVWYTVCNFIVRAAGFITTPIFTRLLTQDDIGAFANINSWLSFIVIIATFDLYASVSIARFDYKKDLNEYIASSLVLGSLITGVFYIIVLLFRTFFENLFLLEFKYINLIFIYCLVYPALQMFQLKSRIFYKYKTSVAVTLISIFSSIGSSLLSIFLCTDKLAGRTFGYYIPSIVICFVIYIYLLTSSRTISTSYWKYALSISIPMMWHTISGVILSSSDRVMITRFSGNSDTALYSIGYSCATIVSILWTSMNTAWSPWAYEKMDEKNYTALKRASKPYSIFFGIIVLFFMLFAPEAIMIMGGPEYMAAIPVIPPVMTGYIFQFMYSLYVNIEFYHKKQKFIAFGSTLAACINIILNYIFIPRLGYVAAAYTTLFGYIVLFVIHFLFVYKMGKSNWYDTKFNFSFLIIALLFLPFLLFLYTFNYIRYTLIGLILIICSIILIRLRHALRQAIKLKSLRPLLDAVQTASQHFFKK